MTILIQKVRFFGWRDKFFEKKMYQFVETGTESNSDGMKKSKKMGLTHHILLCRRNEMQLFQFLNKFLE